MLCEIRRNTRCSFGESGSDLVILIGIHGINVVATAAPTAQTRLSTKALVIEYEITSNTGPRNSNGMILLTFVTSAIISNFI